MLKIINNAKSIFFFSFKNKKVQSQQQHKLPQWLQVIKKKNEYSANIQVILNTENPVVLNIKQKSTQCLCSQMMPRSCPYWRHWGTSTCEQPKGQTHVYFVHSSTIRL